MTEDINDLYEQRCEERSDIVEHLPTLHDAVVSTNAQVVVELGVRNGNSTTALLAGVVKTGGHLWSVDIRPMPSSKRSPLEEAAGDFWSLIIGDDLTVRDQLPASIDVLFIDTSHVYRHTLAELDLYGPHSKTILLHDTELGRHYLDDPPFPVKQAMKEWCDANGRAWENRPNCYGLGIIGGEAQDPDID